MPSQTNHQSEEIRSTQRAFSAPPQPRAESLWQGESTAHLSPLLLSARNIGGRGNTPTRAEAMHSMQRTHGNAATLRAVQRTPVQRDTPPGTEMADKPNVEELAAAVYAQVQAMLEVAQARNGEPSI